MLAIDLIELSGLISLQEPNWLDEILTLPSSRKASLAHAYWQTNRTRFQFWDQCLDRIEMHNAPVPTGLFDEIISSELLSYMCLQLLIKYDGSSSDSPLFTSVARSTLISHQAAIHRVFNVVLSAVGTSDERIERGQKLNQIRRTTEYWKTILGTSFSERNNVASENSDLYGRMFVSSDDIPIPADSNLAIALLKIKTRMCWESLQPSLLTSYQNVLINKSANVELNDHIANAVAALIPQAGQDILLTYTDTILDRIPIVFSDLQKMLNTFNDEDINYNSYACERLSRYAEHCET